MDAAGPSRTAQYVATSATRVGVRGILCPLVSAVLIQTLGVRSVYLTAAVVMALAIILLSLPIRAAAVRFVEAGAPASGERSFTPARRSRRSSPRGVPGQGRGGPTPPRPCPLTLPEVALSLCPAE